MELPQVAPPVAAEDLGAAPAARKRWRRGFAKAIGRAPADADLTDRRNQPQSLDVINVTFVDEDTGEIELQLAEPAATAATAAAAADGQAEAPDPDVGGSQQQRQQLPVRRPATPGQHRGWHLPGTHALANIFSDAYDMKEMRLTTWSRPKILMEVMPAPMAAALLAFTYLMWLLAIGIIVGTTLRRTVLVPLTSDDCYNATATTASVAAYSSESAFGAASSAANLNVGCQVVNSSSSSGTFPLVFDANVTYLDRISGIVAMDAIYGIEDYDALPSQLVTNIKLEACTSSATEADAPCDDGWELVYMVEGQKAAKAARSDGKATNNGFQYFNLYQPLGLNIERYRVAIEVLGAAPSASYSGDATYVSLSAAQLAALAAGEYRFKYQRWENGVVMAASVLFLCCLSFLMLVLWCRAVFKPQRRGCKAWLEGYNKTLHERRWLFWLGIAILLYQDPASLIVLVRATEVTSQMEMSRAVISNAGVTIFMVVALFISDGVRRDQHRRRRTFYGPKLTWAVGNYLVALMVAASSQPTFQRNPGPNSSPYLSITNWTATNRRFFLAAACAELTFTLAWALWIGINMYLSGRILNRLPYLPTRYQQLSYRFFGLQALLLAISFAALTIWRIIEITNSATTNALTGNVAERLLIYLNASETYLGAVVVATAYLFMLFVLYLPPEYVKKSGMDRYQVQYVYFEYSLQFSKLRRQNAFMGPPPFEPPAPAGVVWRARRLAAAAGVGGGGQRRRPKPGSLGARHFGRAKKRQRHDGGGEAVAQPKGILGRNSAAARPVFCVETAAWLMELAFEAYADPPGFKNPNGYYWKEIDVARIGFELVGHIFNEEHDTHCFVVKDSENERLVVCFRGSVSTQHWLDNLRFLQSEFNLTTLCPAEEQLPPEVSDDLDSYIEDALTNFLGAVTSGDDGAIAAGPDASGGDGYSGNGHGNGEGSGSFAPAAASNGGLGGVAGSSGSGGKPASDVVPVMTPVLVGDAAGYGNNSSEQEGSDSLTPVSPTSGAAAAAAGAANGVAGAAAAAAASKAGLSNSGQKGKRRAVSATFAGTTKMGKLARSLLSFSSSVDDREGSDADGAGPLSPTVQGGGSSSDGQAAVNGHSGGKSAGSGYAVDRRGGGSIGGSGAGKRLPSLLSPTTIRTLLRQSMAGPTASAAGEGTDHDPGVSASDLWSDGTVSNRNSPIRGGFQGRFGISKSRRFSAGAVTEDSSATIRAAGSVSVGWSSVSDSAPGALPAEATALDVRLGGSAPGLGPGVPQLGKVSARPPRPSGAWESGRSFSGASPTAFANVRNSSRLRRPSQPGFSTSGGSGLFTPPNGVNVEDGAAAAAAAAALAENGSDDDDADERTTTGTARGQEWANTYGRSSVRNMGGAAMNATAGALQNVGRMAEAGREALDRGAHAVGLNKVPIIRRYLWGQVHTGFWDAYAGVRPELHRMVRKALLDWLLDGDDHPGLTIFVTGHSLGGALATHCALDLQTYVVRPLNERLKGIGKARRRVLQRVFEPFAGNFAHLGRRGAGRGGGGTGTSAGGSGAGGPGSGSGPQRRRPAAAATTPSGGSGGGAGITRAGSGRGGGAASGGGGVMSLVATSSSATAPATAGMAEDDATLAGPSTSGAAFDSMEAAVPVALPAATTTATDGGPKSPLRWRNSLLRGLVGRHSAASTPASTASPAAEANGAVDGEGEVSGSYTAADGAATAGSSGGGGGSDGGGGGAAGGGAVEEGDRGFHPFELPPILGRLSRFGGTSTSAAHKSSSMASAAASSGEAPPPQPRGSASVGGPAHLNATGNSGVSSSSRVDGSSSSAARMLRSPDNAQQGNASFSAFGGGGAAASDGHGATPGAAPHWRAFRQLNHAVGNMIHALDPRKRGGEDGADPGGTGAGAGRGGQSGGFAGGQDEDGLQAFLRKHDPALGEVHIKMVSFGAPRVGNSLYAAHYNEAVPDSFRVVVDGDFVPGVPTWWYTHVGKKVIIDGKGRGSLIIAPSFVEKRFAIKSKRSYVAHQLEQYRAGLRGNLLLALPKGEAAFVPPSWPFGPPEMDEAFDRRLGGRTPEETLTAAEALVRRHLEVLAARPAASNAAANELEDASAGESKTGAGSFEETGAAAAGKGAAAAKREDVGLDMLDAKAAEAAASIVSQRSGEHKDSEQENAAAAAEAAADPAVAEALAPGVVVATATELAADGYLGSAAKPESG